MIGKILTIAALATITYANLPTTYTLGHQEPTLPYLQQGKLYYIDASENSAAYTAIKAAEIFNASPVVVMAIRRVGCKFCRHEASRLSSLADQLNQRGIRLIGITHEIIDIDAFRPYLKGDIYYDPNKHFFGPKQRWMPLWMGFLRWSSYVNKHQGTSIKGNLKGEGRLLGGVYLIDKDRITFMHLERHWGDYVDIQAVQKAIEQIN
ncbi:MAG: AhpC/TSA family protein [Candidatus Cardinium sp.]|nr:AhpC/TSA family protein [Candidatus Cardinium sp.]